MSRVPLVDERRLVVPSECTLAYWKAVNGEPWFKHQFETRGEPVCGIDVLHLADILNDETSDAAVYVRTHAAILIDFGGSTGGPAYWKDPYLLIPVSTHYFETDAGDYAPPPDAICWSEEVGASCMLAFLPMVADLPEEIIRRIEESGGDAATLPFPPGRYSVLYEQFPAPQENMSGLMRNIVVRRDA